MNDLTNNNTSNDNEEITMPEFMPIQFIDPEDYKPETRFIGTVDDPIEVLDCTNCGETVAVWDYMPNFGRCANCINKENTMEEYTFICDFCDGEFPSKDAQIHLVRRPSCPTELIERVRTCSSCMEGYSWDDIAKIQKAIEETGTWEDQPTMFLTLYMGL